MCSLSQGPTVASHLPVDLGNHQVKDNINQSYGNTTAEADYMQTTSPHPTTGMRGYPMEMPPPGTTFLLAPSSGDFNAPERQAYMLVPVCWPETSPLSTGPQRTTVGHIKRPSNSFLLYRKDKHRQVKAARAGVKNEEVSKIIARMWAAESEEVRGIYKAKALLCKEEHMRKYPSYKYAPRKATK